MELVGMIAVGVVFYGALVLMALSIVRTGKQADALSANTFVECAMCHTHTDVPVWRQGRPHCPACQQVLEARVAELAARYKLAASSYPRDAA